jgi:4-hydroxy-tetrahydrodipicolinate synthase
VLEGHAAYARHLNPFDTLFDSQQAFLEAQWRQFRTWYDAWPGRGG